MRKIFPLVFVVALASIDAAAAAQQGAPPFKVSAGVQEGISENHVLLIGKVELEQGDTTLYADEVELFYDEDRALARGNVVFSQGPNRIAADRAEFNTKTRLGSFYNAWGIANIQPPRQSAPVGGFVAPQMSGQDTDVYFFGDVVEKIGPKKYRITNGGFTTCVQPTPRWDLHADSVVLNIDHYTLLRQAIFKVKGVPLFYTPILYYPTKEDDRATGFLIPTYGSSTIRGQAIHNAFFWAINRSHDATILHDWYSKTGQGIGSEYRYALATGDGNFKSYLLNQHETTYSLSGGGTHVEPATRSYELRGGANQQLPGNLRARARVDYFSSLTQMQLFNTGIQEATRSQRSFGGNVVGAWRAYSLNATYDYNENFYSSSGSAVTGTAPRLTVNHNEQPIGSSDVYFSLNGDYTRLLSQSKSDGRVFNDQGLSRFDFTPSVRYPFKKWPWFTVNSSLSWRDTFYTRSLAPDTGAISQAGVNRRYFTLRGQAVGPVFIRVWDTPGSGYAERFKHAIEPSLTVQRTTAIDAFNRIIKNDVSVDAILGTTSYSYGVTNRFYAKRRQQPGQRGQAEEIVTVELRQSYYTNELAVQFDRQYNTTSGTPPNHFTPILLTARARPSNSVNANFRTEFDTRYMELRSLSLGGGYNWTNRVQTNADWTRDFFIEDLPPYNNRGSLNNNVTVRSDAHTINNRLGGRHTFTYDFTQGLMRSQTVSAFYNAQCCGIGFEYQIWNYRGVFAPIPSDRRFFLSFTLAGLGNFSPFNGAMSGMPR